MANPQATPESFGNHVLLDRSDNVAPRTSLHDRLVDNVYFEYESLKTTIYNKVYNEKHLDLPELPSFRASEKQSEIAPTPRDRGIDKHLEIHSGGRERDYILHVPPGYDPAKPMPLVVVLHGFTQDAEKISELSQMSEKADKEGFIVAYPNATNWLGKVRSWNVDNGVQLPGTNSNDLGFVKDMVGAIKNNMNIDNNRVYATGFSNGGMLAYKLASEMSDTFSAIAVVSSGSSGKEVKPAEAVSVMLVHGTADPVIPLDGVSTSETLVKLGLPHFQSFRDSFRSWAANLNISSKPVVERDGDRVVSARSLNRQTGAELVAYAVKDGGHEWPGSERAKTRYPGSPEATFQTTEKIWTFFKNHNKITPQPVIADSKVLSA